MHIAEQANLYKYCYIIGISIMYELLKHDSVTVGKNCNSLLPEANIFGNAISDNLND